MRKTTKKQGTELTRGGKATMIAFKIVMYAAIILGAASSLVAR